MGMGMVTLARARLTMCTNKKNSGNECFLLDLSHQIHPIFQIPKTKCKSVPTKKCTDAPVYVPKKECKHFPKTVCLKDPVQVERAMMTQFLFPNPIFPISDCP